MLTFRSVRIVYHETLNCMTYDLLRLAGNVVDCADKAIVSWRVEEENLRLRRSQIRRMIEEALPGKDVCFIRNPPFEEDTTGENDKPAVLHYRAIDSELRINLIFSWGRFQSKVPGTLLFFSLFSRVFLEYIRPF